TWNAQPIGKLFDFSSHTSKVFCYSHEPVALFNAKFPCTSKRQPLFGLRSQHGQYGQLIDQARDQFRWDLAACKLAGIHMQITNQFAIQDFEVNHSNLAAHGYEQIQKSRTSGIQSHVMEHEVRIWNDQSSGNEKRCGRNIAGYVEFLPLEPSRTA